MKKEFLRLLFMYAYSERNYIHDKLYTLLYSEKTDVFYEYRASTLFEVLETLGLQKYAEKIYYKLNNIVYNAGFNPQNRKDIKNAKRALDSVNIITLIKEVRQELEA